MRREQYKSVSVHIYTHYINSNYFLYIKNNSELKVTNYMMMSYAYLLLYSIYIYIYIYISKYYNKYYTVI